jgi:diguanylate cyclase (GGDEF)-like protein
MNVLVVEDDPVSALVLTRALATLGHGVVGASNGARAIEYLAENESDTAIVISDWMMPVIDGLELCRKIRATRTDYYTYFILMSSKDSKEDRVEALAAGVDDFLVKSLDPRELFARLNVAQRILKMQEQLLTHSRQLLDRQAELAALNVALCEQASRDSLTLLKNHRAFYEELERLFLMCAGHDLPLSVVLIDVDEFKLFNDTYGHMAGDDVLRDLATLLQAHLRPQDFLARYGGEEFALIFPMTDERSAFDISERLRMAIESHAWTCRPITSSFGIAGRSRACGTVSSLVHNADNALYASKRDGRNRCTLFDAKTERRLVDRKTPEKKAA